MDSVLRFCSLNIHQLLHLPESVQNLGPLWVNSCFSFENINGQLIKNVHGTTDVESQIVKIHMRNLKISALVSEEEDGPVKNTLTNHKQQVKITESINGYHTVGSYFKLKEFPNDVTGIDNVTGTDFRIYYRLLKSGMLHVSESYRDLLKTDSSYTKFSYNERIRFGKIMYFLKITSCSCDLDECLCDGNHCAIVNPVSISNEFTTTYSQNQIQLHHIFEFQNTTHKIFGPITNLISPCFNINNNTKSFICMPINKFECE